MGNAGNQLPHGGHFFALQQLLLRAAQGVVGLAGFFEQKRLVDRRRDLIADGGKQIQLRSGKFARISRQPTQNPDDRGPSPIAQQPGRTECLRYAAREFPRARPERHRKATSREPGESASSKLGSTATGEIAPPVFGPVADRSGAASDFRGFIEEINAGSRPPQKSSVILCNARVRPSSRRGDCRKQFRNRSSGPAVRGCGGGFRFQPASLGDVEQESLVRDDRRRIRRALQSLIHAAGANFAVAPPEPEFEIVTSPYSWSIRVERSRSAGST